LMGLGGLNVYHHSIILLVSWMWLEFAASLQYWGIVLNTAVHIAMYAYFGIACLGYTLPTVCRSAITLLQISQFVVSIVLFVANVRLDQFTPNHPPCVGQWPVYVSLVFNLTLLSEFVSIFKRSDRRLRRPGNENESQSRPREPALSPPGHR